MQGVAGIELAFVASTGGAELAGSFAKEHPVLNLVLTAAVLLTITGVLIFAKPLDRLLDRLNLRVLQALGLADRDRTPDRDPGDEPDQR